MAKLRVGVVLSVPSPIAAEIDGIRRACGDGGLGRIPSHCTLVPPVNLREESVGEALRVVRGAASAGGPFEVTLGPPRTFLPDSPTLYLPVSGVGVDALGSLRDRVFNGPLERTLTRPFVPHVTLADEMDAARLQECERALADYVVRTKFDHVQLLREQHGRVWTVLADVGLGEVSIVGQGGLALELSASQTVDPEAAEFLGEIEPPSTGLPERRMATGRPLVITARREGPVVGVAVGNVDDDVAVLRGLVVLTADRGQGIGAHLLAAFQSHVVRLGGVRVVAHVDPTEPLGAFLVRHGWAGPQPTAMLVRDLA